MKTLIFVFIITISHCCLSSLNAETGISSLDNKMYFKELSVKDKGLLLKLQAFHERFPIYLQTDESSRACKSGEEIFISFNNSYVFSNEYNYFCFISHSSVKNGFIIEEFSLDRMLIANYHILRNANGVISYESIPLPKSINLPLQYTYSGNQIDANIIKGKASESEVDEEDLLKMIKMLKIRADINVEPGTEIYIENRHNMIWTNDKTPTVIFVQRNANAEIIDVYFGMLNSNNGIHTLVLGGCLDNYPSPLRQNLK
ncbi:MAG: hypothetical protein HQL32_15555 [Planctomycetes bacterium]|nr:hypothetical protein [Planctomycetota bacterium]